MPLSPLPRWSLPSPLAAPPRYSWQDRPLAGRLAAGGAMSVELLTLRARRGPGAPSRGLNEAGLIEDLPVAPQVLAYARTLRRACDAVLVGPTTVLLDNPSLAFLSGGGRPCVRVTLDPAGKIPPDYRFLDGAVRTVIGVSRSTPAAYLRLLAERGVETVSCGFARVDLELFVAALERMGLRRLLVEGGGRLNRALFDLGLVDRVHFLVAESPARSGERGREGERELESAPFAGLRLADQAGLGDYRLLLYDVEKKPRRGGSGGAGAGRSC